MDKPRLVQLDLMRAGAVLLVMGHHGFLLPDQAGQLIRPAKLWWRLSDSGVDLFFVLSGFLIGSLLLREWQKEGQLDIQRFLLRRGFKIWPSYFFYIFISIVWHTVISVWDRPLLGVTYMLPNLLHLQNYLLTPVTHTWSLAVEEHFYLALPFVLVYLGRRQLSWMKAWRIWALCVIFIVCGLLLAQRLVLTAGKTPYFFGENVWWVGAFRTQIFPVVFGLQLCLLASLIVFLPRLRMKATADLPILPWLALALIVFSTGMRIGSTLAIEQLHSTWTFVFFATHLRLDGFALGLLLAWFYVFRPELLAKLGQRRILLFSVGVALMAVVVALPDSVLMSYMIGMLLFPLAGACWLTALLHLPLETAGWQRFFSSWPLRALIFTGTYSYTIYLWHVTPVRGWAAQHLLVSLPATQRWISLTLLYIGSSILLGWLASRLVEIPLLRIRERMFPAKARALAEAG